MHTFNHFLHIGYRAIAVSVFAFLMATTNALFGQSTSGSITGTARDVAGAVVPDAVVTVTNSETNLSRQTRTNEEGVFTIAQLPPGTYDIVVEKSGFKKIQKSDMILSAIAQANAGYFYFGSRRRNQHRHSHDRCRSTSNPVGDRRTLWHRDRYSA